MRIYRRFKTHPKIKVPKPLQLIEFRHTSVIDTSQSKKPGASNELGAPARQHLHEEVPAI